MKMPDVLNIITVLLTGLLAGLLYAYDCSVISGLGKLTDSEYLHSFQSINREILTPYFFISFFGSMLLLPIATWLSFSSGRAAAFPFMLAATLFYAVGVMAVTMNVNVPLNNMLDKVNLASYSAEQLHSLRQQFEGKWNLYHHIRTYSAIISFLLAIVSVTRK